MNESGFTDQQEKFLTKLSTGHRETYDRYWNKKASDYTGKDMSTPDGKKHVQRVYNHAEASMEATTLTKNTMITEGAKFLFRYGWITIPAYLYFTKQG